MILTLLESQQLFVKIGLVPLVSRRMDCSLADGVERISAEQLAEWMGTISHEMVSAIHADQPRIAVNR